MSETVRIDSIAQADWIALRNHLASNGWAMEKGGGLDHSWATLRRGELRIEMLYDRWDEGELSCSPEQANEIEAMLPGPA